MIEKRIIELIVVPPQFGVLFFLPLIGSYLIFRFFDSLFLAALFYFALQIGLALLARHIYG